MYVKSKIRVEADNFKTDVAQQYLQMLNKQLRIGKPVKKQFQSMDASKSKEFIFNTRPPPIFTNKNVKVYQAPRFQKSSSVAHFCPAAFRKPFAQQLRQIWSKLVEKRSAFFHQAHDFLTLHFHLRHQITQEPLDYLSIFEKMVALLKTSQDQFVLKRKIAQVINRQKNLKIYLNSCLSTNSIQQITPGSHTRSQSLQSETAKIEAKFKNFQVLSPYKERTVLFPDPQEQKLVKYRKALANWNNRLDPNISESRRKKSQSKSKKVLSQKLK